MGYRSIKPPLVKLLILFIIRLLAENATLANVTYVFLYNETIDFITMHEHINELIKGKLIEKQSSGDVYQLTDSGKASLESFENRIPFSLRRQHAETTRTYLREMEQNEAVTAEVFRVKETAEYGAWCCIHEHGQLLMELKLNMGSNENAAAACKAFRKNAKKIYREIIDSLDVN